MENQNRIIVKYIICQLALADVELPKFTTMKASNDRFYHGTYPFIEQNCFVQIPNYNAVFDTMEEAVEALEHDYYHGQYIILPIYYKYR